MASISCQHIYKIYPGEPLRPLLTSTWRSRIRSSSSLSAPLLRQVHHPAYDRRPGGDLQGEMYIGGRRSTTSPRRTVISPWCSRATLCTPI